MAAKKTKKKTPTKKVVKKKARKSAVRKPPARKRATRTSRATDGPLSEFQMRARLAQKVLAIHRAMPKAPQTGTHTADGDEYCFTKAAEVFEAYHELMELHQLVMIPTSIISFHDAGWYRVDMQFELIDCETGYVQRVAGSGLGNNAIWSLHSAQTVAKKQAMLLAFMSSWDTWLLEEALIKQCMDEGARQGSPERVYKAMEGFFGQMQKRVDNIPAVVAKSVTEQLKDFNWKTGGKK